MSGFRDLPQVDEIARDVRLTGPLGHALAVSLAREAVAAARARVARGESIDADAVRADALARATALQHALLGRVVNATGVILHTNLGRAPLSAAAVEAVRAAAGATNIEFDLEGGERGARAPAASQLLCALSGAAAAHVVNNNAAALVLALAAIARGREVIVSRGELIEIGGEFRLPAIMEASGATLVEVGTTNRTRTADVRAAITERTGLVLKVHPSNFRIVGFTAEPPVADVVAVAHEAGVPVLYDIGSGLLTADPLLPGEPDATSALAAGVDLVCFSGDKLLGGPQAGVLAGREDLVAACRRHPLARAFRADKMTLAALEATLGQIAAGDTDAVPVQRMIAATDADLRPRAERIAAAAGGEIVEGESVVGGGSMPGHTMPSPLVAFRDAQPDVLAAALRRNRPPVIARVENDSLVIDVRTVDPDDDDIVIDALKRAHP